MQLLHILFGIPLPKYNATPKSTYHSLDNIDKAMKMLQQAGIKSTIKPIRAKLLSTALKS